MLELIVLIAGLVLCIWTPIETNKVRRGWVHKKFKGDRAAFLVKYRKQLTMIGWLGVILGPLTILIGVIDYQDEVRLAVKLVGGLIWLSVGAVGFLSRRKLDAGPLDGATPIPPPQ